MKKWMCNIILCGIILTQIVYTTYVFVDEKEGFHSDEVWSYGLANSYFHAFHTFEKGIPLLEFTHSIDQFVNNDEWISGKVLSDYITVQKDQRFAYDSVYDNNAHDMHPPLYHMILHTVCSFFPDSFSWWYGFGLNLLFLIGTQIFLYLTMKEIAGDDVAALAACVLYAGSKGAVCTFTFIRQYTLLVMLCMGFTYFSAVFYGRLRGNMRQKSAIVMAAVCAMLAFLTHYYGIAYIGVFTAAFCLYLLCRRKYKVMFGYGGCMLAALGGAFAIYPPALKHIFQYNNDVDKTLSFSPPVQIRILLSDLFQYNYGFTTGYFPTAFWNIVLPLTAAIIIAIAALLFPFRHEEWFGRLIAWVTAKCTQAIAGAKRLNFIPVFATAGITALYELVAHTVDVYQMGRFSMRYVSLSLPLICMVVVLALSGLFSAFKLKKWRWVLLYAVIFGIILRVQLTAVYPYAYPEYGETGELHEITKGKNVLVIDGHWYNYVTTMTQFTCQLYEADKVCFTSQETLEECMGQKDFENVKIDYLIIENSLISLTPEEKIQIYKWMPEREILDAGMNSYKDDETKEFEEKKRQGIMEQIKKINGGAAYEIISVRVGQKGLYYICKFS